MHQNQNITAKEKKYKGFPFRQRLVPAILVSLAISLTVFVFGPFEIYSANADQFGFSLLDFLGWSVLYAIVAAGIICAVLLPLRGRVFDIVFALFFWVALMLMVQGNYLNFGISSLAGDGVDGGGISTGMQILNCIIWLLVGAACVAAILLIRQKHRELIHTVCTIAMVTVIGMQVLTFALTSLTGDVWEKKTHDDRMELLTYENLNEAGSEHNVIWFIIDRFDVDYYENYALKECPEIFYSLDGFTYYDNMVSLYTRTFPSVPYMLTGIEHDYQDARVDYFADAYSNSNFLKLLKENDYSVNIYTERYYCYEDAAPLREYISNSSRVESVKTVKKPLLAKDMLRVSLYRYLPMIAKGLTGDISTPQFEKYIDYGTQSPIYSGDMKAAYDFLNQNPMVTDGKNNFAFIHVAGCHLPNHYNQDFSPVTSDERDSVSSAMIQSFKIINLYLDQLKELGLYENATVIISGDHGNADPSMPMTRAPVAALFVKPSGSAGTPIATSHAPVTQGDIIPAILESEGIEASGDFGRSLFDVKENEHRVRICKFDDWKEDSSGQRNDEIFVFEITGNARDLKNWKEISRGEFIGYYLD
ncbi:MAG: hypothetical protein E7629_02945 [Ruminococcaceae bacterium]|nr:hypothetical protein [Oscillospiraceae bacterium]